MSTHPGSTPAATALNHTAIGAAESDVTSLTASQMNGGVITSSASESRDGGKRHSPSPTPTGGDVVPIKSSVSQVVPVAGSSGPSQAAGSAASDTVLVQPQLQQQQLYNGINESTHAAAAPVTNADDRLR